MSRETSPAPLACEAPDMTWVTLTVEGTMVFHDGVPALRQMQEAIGGYVEVVSFRLAEAEAAMWLDEEGKLVDRPQRNWKAEAICPLPHDWVAGLVVFTGGPDRGGHTLGLSEAQVRELRRIDRNVHVILLDDHAPGGMVTW